MTSLTSRTSLTLDFPPSCIAFCPSEPEYFVVGTYYLHHGEDEDQTDAHTEAAAATDEAKQAVQERSGCLILFRLVEETISQVCTTETAGAVLDVQWKPHLFVAEEAEEDGREENMLAVATSVGKIEFFHLYSKTLVSSKRYESIQVTDADILVLSLAWHPSMPNTIGFTLSNGKVCICSLPNNSKGRALPLASHTLHINPQVTIHEMYTHTLEAWTLAFTSPTSLLSGGDDAVLQRTDFDDGGITVPRWQDRRIHMAGVTAILPLTDTLVLTGSYDDHIRLLSLPGQGGPGRVVVETELDLGGGVWRLKLLDRPAAVPGRTAIKEGEEGGGFVILASCMHAGTRVVRLSKHRKDDADEGWSFEVLATFEEHKSMNYGSDVQPSAVGGSEVDMGVKSIVSTSFYDKLLCLWKVDLRQLVAT